MVHKISASGRLDFGSPKLWLVSVLSFAAWFPSPTLANLELARKNNCMACHTEDRKSVYPNFKDIAARYKGQPDAETRLAASVRKGSVGAWGKTPMRPNQRISDADLKTLVKWIQSR